MEDHDAGPVSWDAARDLARRVGAIGAHGLRHAILTCETEAPALSDVQQSAAEVSSVIGTPCKSFAFPQRKSYGADGEVGLEAGAQTVMTTGPM